MQKRIEVIDALRAVTLLGILLTHTAQLFCFSNMYNEQVQMYMENNSLVHYILLLFSGKCKIIFSILFGLSFYFLLRNPNYSNYKYVWRCILLIGFGLLNKLFYTTEILMWYGLCGILLLPFRHIKSKIILYFSLFIYLLFLFLRTVNMEFMSFERDFYVRYSTNSSLIDIISYPIYLSILDYLDIVFPKGLLETVSYFLLGYYWGKSGIILSLNRYITVWTVIVFGGIFAFTTFIYHQSFDLVWYSLKSLAGALSYSITFIYLYLKFKIKLRGLECYGKMGLTNYTLQNVFGVVLSVLLFLPYNFSFSSILLFMLFIYLLQLIFSYYWLIYNKYGPLESFWRRITNIVN